MFFKMIGLLSLHVVFLNAACFASNTDLISDEEKNMDKTQYNQMICLYG